MGLFDFFKKKQIQPEEPEAQVSTDPDTRLREGLKQKLETKGHTVVIEEDIVYVDGDIGILIEYIENKDLHPMIMQIGARVTVRDYFGRGISEVFIGLGDTLEQKVESGLNNFLTVTFPPILDALNDVHDPDLDFTVEDNGKEILWHPKLGAIGFQGKWSEYPSNETLFYLLKDWLKDQLPNKKFNWLKIYIGKQDDGSITGDCSLNNDFKEDGYGILEEYAKTLNNSSFIGAKQFILFRRCDACDEETIQ